MKNIKLQAPSSKQAPISNSKNGKPYDLHERTLVFAKRVRDFVQKLQRTLPNIEYARQLIRSSGSVGANYIEANESFSKKDFALRVKICRKESRETRYWLELISTNANPDLNAERIRLQEEARELTMIFSSIVSKVS